MGVNLTPIVSKHVSSLEQLKGRSFAVDASNYLYQFLALIRMADGSLLTDSEGNVTSHLMGLLFRTTHLMWNYKMRLIFVFDGKPPKLKAGEIIRRRKIKKKARIEWKEALEEGDYAKAYSKAVVTSRLTGPMVEDSKHLLQLMGVPFVQAPSEAEAQAAFMAAKGDVWAACSKDYDCLLFGSPRLIRFLTISGKEYLPSKRTFRILKPEIIVLDEFLADCGITRHQLVDLAILVGTDFNSGIKGVGAKTALKLVRAHEKLENMPEEIREKITDGYQKIRELFLEPALKQDYEISYGDLQEEMVYDFLCQERGFSKKRVRTGVERIKRFYSWTKQSDLVEWLG